MRGSQVEGAELWKVRLKRGVRAAGVMDTDPPVIFSLLNSRQPRML